MRLLFVTDFHEGQTIDQIESAIASVVQYCGVDTLGGLILHNDDWHSENEDRLNFGIDIGQIAHDRGMAFFQPLLKLQPDAVIHNLQSECRKRGWSGNYLLVTEGWRFVAPVQLSAIERQLEREDCNYVLLPEKGDERPLDSDAEPDFTTVWEQSEIPSGPHLGKLDAFIGAQVGGQTAFTNGGYFKRVVEKS